VLVSAASEAVAILELPGTFATRDPVESGPELVSRIRDLVGEPA
jgi:hypothetical protein